MSKTKNAKSTEDWKAEQEARIEASVNRLLEMFETGDLPAAIAHKFIAGSSSQRPCDSWSLSNYCIMIAYGTTDARGFKAWLEVGRAVRKGEKAIYILGPVLVADKERRAAGIEGAVKLIGFKPVPVFALESTDTVDEDTWEKHRAKASPELQPAVLPPLFEVAQAMGLRVQYAGKRESQGAWGWYSPGRLEIRLFTHAPSVFLHELAHHSDRLNQGQLKAGQDAAQEIVAEMSAAVLCHLLEPQFPGLNLVSGLTFSREYVAHYASKTGQPSARAVLSLLDRIGKCVGRILEVAEGLEAAPPVEVLAEEVAA